MKEPTTFNEYGEAAMRSMRARILRQSLGYSTTEFAEITDIPYGSLTQWGHAEKGSLSAAHCHQVIASMAAKGHTVTMAYLVEGDMSDMSVRLATRIQMLLDTGMKLTEKQAAEILKKVA